MVRIVPSSWIHKRSHEASSDRSVAEVYTGRWFRDAEQLRAFKAEGALLIHGAKE